MKKKGISLIILAITIIVLAILVGMVVTGTSVATQNAKMETLANELVQIEEVLDTARALETELPIKDDAPIHTLTSLKTLVGSNYSNSLEAEIVQNGDQDDNFRVIDMTKLGANVSSKGTGKESGTDIFVFAEKTLNVYYVAGVHTSGQSYYSLTTSLTDLVKVENTDVSTTDPDISVTISSSYRASVVTKEKSNEIKLFIQMPTTGKIKVNIGVVNGATTRYFDITNKIIDGEFIYKVGAVEGLTKDMVAATTLLKLQFVNTSTGEEQIEETQLNISNIDVTQPAAPQKIRASKAGVNNVIEISSADADVAYYIYDYDTKLNSSGEEEKVFQTNATTDAQQVEALKAKGVKSENGVIKLPRYIKSIVVIAVDEAGNTSTKSICTVDSSLVINEL